MSSSEKCIAHGCPNHKDEGKFFGDLCAPCHRMITTGVLGPSNATFARLHRIDTMMFNENEMVSLRNWIDTHVWKGHGVYEKIKISILQRRDSGIGVASEVHCSCGESHNFTDYGAW